VQYCGRDCQVHHWKKGGHRRECMNIEHWGKLQLPQKQYQERWNKHKCGVTYIFGVVEVVLHSICVCIKIAYIF
jgi:hypothetical protein